MAYKALGLDVSVWQRGIDFAQAKRDGAEFVIIKASEGNFRDPAFEDHYKSAKDAGLKVGAYHYVTSTDPDGAVKEAEFFASCLSGKQFEMPVYADVESPDLFANPKEVNTEIARAFALRMEKKGYFAGIYTYADFLAYNLDASKTARFAHWIGKIGKDKPDVGLPSAVFGIWQFGGDRNLIRDKTVGGVVCDQNYAYIDYEAKIKALGLNGFGKTAAPSEIKAGDLVRVKAGARYANGVAVPALVAKQKWYVKRVDGRSAVIDLNEAGTMRILSAVDVGNLEAVK